MNKELILLVGCLSIGLVNGCAFAMGKAPRCEDPEIPARPQYEVCISNDHGGGGCFDPRRVPSQYDRTSLLNYVCVNSVSHQMDEEWIKFVLDSCKR